MGMSLATWEGRRAHGDVPCHLGKAAGRWKPGLSSPLARGSVRKRWQLFTRGSGGDGEEGPRQPLRAKELFSGGRCCR